VLHVLYLMFNEGYAATSGRDASRPELTAEAIRLTRAVHRSLPEDAEVTGLLALMLLTEDVLAALEGDDRMARHHRLAGLRAHFRELAGQREAALADYVLAAQRATSLPERRYLESRAARLAGHG